MTHIPVLLHEIIEGLRLSPDSVVLDATVGSGGHARALAECLSERGMLIGLDADSDAIARATKALRGVRPRVLLVRENFRHLARVLDEAAIVSVHAVLFDLGISSVQLDDSTRGFSFLTDAPLSMTLVKKPRSGDLTAYDIVNTWSEETLADIIRGFGEERFARRIAHAIVRERLHAPITHTFQLRDCIVSAIPKRYHRRSIHPATKTFQAIRIAVNDELGALSSGLAQAWSRLLPGGRIAAISFHSLEDRIVKRFFREQVLAHAAHLPAKKPLTPTPAEVRCNPRSRSAKVRIIEKVLAH